MAKNMVRLRTSNLLDPGDLPLRLLGWEWDSQLINDDSPIPSIINQ